MTKVNCEGYEIAFSANDEQCAGCKVAAKCKSETDNKLRSSGTTGKGEQKTMAKKLTEKQLKAALKKAKTKKDLAAINKAQGAGIKPADAKGKSQEEIAEMILLALYPPPADDDDFDADDLDDDDFGDDDGADDGADDDAGDDPDDDLDDDAGDDASETADEPEDEPDDDVETDTLKALTERVEDLEARIVKLQETLDKAPAAKASRKSSKEEKEAAKAELVAGCPYTKKSIAELSGKQVKQLASGLGIKSFGLKTDAVVAAILKSKKNKKAK
ncbi:MAG: hypothetical protein ACYTBJ_00755 [Planctomycetota bacterium]|jgi:hypothetical protein